jgi:hypothetical protein
VLVTAGKLRQGLELERIPTPVEAEFFLTSLFIKLIDPCEGDLSVVTLIASVTKRG